MTCIFNIHNMFIVYTVPTLYGITTVKWLMVSVYRLQVIVIVVIFGFSNISVIYVNKFDIFGTMMVHIVMYTRAYVWRSRSFIKRNSPYSPLHPDIIGLLCVKSSPEFVYTITMVFFLIFYFFVFYIQLNIIKVNIYTTLFATGKWFFFQNVFPA